MKQTIYLKAKDEHSVMSICGRAPVPVPKKLLDQGFVQVEHKEFCRIRRRIQRHSARTNERNDTVTVTPVEEVGIAPR